MKCETNGFISVSSPKIEPKNSPELLLGKIQFFLMTRNQNHDFRLRHLYLSDNMLEYKLCIQILSAGYLCNKIECFNLSVNLIAALEYLKTNSLDYLSKSKLI